MSKLRKKIVVPISLTLTGCLVVAAFVLNDSLTKVDANVAFNGISDIVSSHGKDKPFNIVEVVPDKKMASIGYLIDGRSATIGLEHCQRCLTKRVTVYKKG